MNPLFLALNILVIAMIVLALAWPRIRERRQERTKRPTEFPSTRAGQELTDAVTEWAKATGVLTTDGNSAGGADVNDDPDAEYS